MGRVVIVTFTVGARAKEGKGGGGGENLPAPSPLPLTRPISSSLREVSTWRFRERIARSKKTPALQASFNANWHLFRVDCISTFEMKQKLSEVIGFRLPS